MNTNLGFCLALHRAHASLQLKLESERSQKGARRKNI
jgi:hypothetical protein